MFQLSGFYYKASFQGESSGLRFKICVLGDLAFGLSFSI